LFDTNCDGNVVLDEFFSLASIFEGSHMTQEMARKMFRKLDTDQSGGIDVEEFVSFLESRMAGMSKEKFDSVMATMKMSAGAQFASNESQRRSGAVVKLYRLLATHHPEDQILDELYSLAAMFEGPNSDEWAVAYMEMFEQLDGDGGGAIGMGKFAIFVVGRMAKFTPEEFDDKMDEITQTVEIKAREAERQRRARAISELYRVFDTNHDDVVALDEFSSLAPIFEGSHMTEEKARQMFKKLDSDGSGGIDVDEFVDFVAGKMAGCTNDRFDTLVAKMMRMGETAQKAALDADLARVSAETKAQADCGMFEARGQFVYHVHQS